MILNHLLLCPELDPGFSVLKCNCRFAIRSIFLPSSLPSVAFENILLNTWPFLLVVLPLAPVNLPVSIHHFSVAVALIVSVIPHVDVSICLRHLAHSVVLEIVEFTLVYGLRRLNNTSTLTWEEAIAEPANSNIGISCCDTGKDTLAAECLTIIGWNLTEIDISIYITFFVCLHWCTSFELIWTGAEFKGL